MLPRKKITLDTPTLTYPGPFSQHAKKTLSRPKYETHPGIFNAEATQKNVKCSGSPLVWLCLLDKIRCRNQMWDLLSCTKNTYRTHVEGGGHICLTMCAGQVLCLIQKPWNECVLLFITCPWGFCDTRKSLQILSALVFLFVSIIFLSPSLSLGSLFLALLLSFPLWRENSSPASAEKYTRSSKNTMECSDRSCGPAEGRQILFYGPHSSKSVLFIQQQVTTKVISWHFPNTAALDIGRTRQSQHVVTVADCVWRSTQNVLTKSCWPKRR